MRDTAVLCIVTMLLLAGCLQSGGSPDHRPSDEDTPLEDGPFFSSGFEDDVEIIDVNENFADIIGSDGQDWETDLEHNAHFGDFRIFYEGGNDSQRSARIIEDEGEDVLEFRLSEANVNAGEKGRVSTSLKENPNLTEFRYVIDVKLEDAFELIEPAEGRLTWMTIAEFWNDRAQTEYAFRITLAIHKQSEEPNTPLSWYLHGQTQNQTTLDWVNVWTHYSDGAPVPVKQWFTLDVSIVEGDASTGSVAISLTDQNGTEWTIMQDEVWTHHPDNANPGGFETLNMMKLYTSAEVLNQLPAGRAFVILWDDFHIYTTVR